MIAERKWTLVAWSHGDRRIGVVSTHSTEKGAIARAREHLRRGTYVRLVVRHSSTQISTWAGATPGHEDGKWYPIGIDVVTVDASLVSKAG